MGNMVEAKTIEAIGFKVAMLEVSCIHCTYSASPVALYYGL